MKSCPTVSVITICRDSELSISPTMVSVLEQSYENIEYLIVDGQSSDNTVAIASEVARRFPHRTTRIISEPDNGISDAMNKGVLASSGEIITHLHAGDRYTNESVIGRVVESFNSYQWRWSVAESIVVDSKGNHLHIYRAHHDYRMLLRKNSIPHQSTFLVRDVFNRHGLFRIDLKQAMDYEYWLRITFTGNERYLVLPFPATYFLEGGRSARIIELLKYLATIRKEIRHSVPNIDRLSDSVFLTRVALFALWSRFNSAIRHRVRKLVSSL